MNFCKMNGTGNDFIIINNIEERIPENKLGSLAKHLCTRRFSVGADGLMAVCAPDTEGCDYRMLFYNADGSLGEMCGNGARCICRYGYEHGLSGGRRVQRVETTAGIIVGERLSKREYRVQMNNPTLIKLGMELNITAEISSVIYAKCVCLRNNETQISYDYVELGDPGLPHAVINYSGIAGIVRHERGIGPEGKNSNSIRAFEDIKEQTDYLRKFAECVRHHECFPKGANVNLYDIEYMPDDTGIPRPCIYLKTFERGVEDFTYACGTGSVATALILKLRGLISGNSVKLMQRGGELTVDFEINDNKKSDKSINAIKRIFLSGPTNIVATGAITDEEMSIFV